EYRGRLVIYHMDAYRLRDEDEFRELGPDEYFESRGVTFVEWADRVARCLPDERLEIRCDAIGQSQRRFVLSATTQALARVLASVAAQMTTE
ncbi:MAG TPA: tRNA (adenosine(37)-N6)-threonylcarbamoyltransferase complex ATPase subunit type 1 TsaE, partial [Lacipirellulaceae bacterium]|nr:tRNA (adenosine(37)-N6)-threonylcarbamoyltransferase complex ATPase subunit type 1 TsaE [Lacipirellulaceae bacterium]